MGEGGEERREAAADSSGRTPFGGGTHHWAGVLGDPPRPPLSHPVCGGQECHLHTKETPVTASNRTFTPPCAPFPKLFTATQQARYYFLKLHCTEEETEAWAGQARCPKRLIDTDPICYGPEAGLTELDSGVA